ncbi:MAG: hypothetical protein GKS07_10420 [Nitrosopumilus sp.]|nr:MAG: hypothetical protein GKS07_10420 [Nitrosopumilus sp.]
MDATGWKNKDSIGNMIMGSSIFVFFGGFLFVQLPIGLHGYFTESNHHPLMMSIMFILISLSLMTITIGGIIHIKEMVQVKKYWLKTLQTGLGIWLFVGAILTVLVVWEIGMEFIMPMFYLATASWIVYVAVVMTSREVRKRKAHKLLEPLNRSDKSRYPVGYNTFKKDE